ncbi:hypothetical protein AA15669_2002 [Saccharibacter floricola DSM 15669]|uniref:ATP-cone domain-containing protein n=2 Tax=Saccharibacter TaxID=231052 RepID=A0ABQ0P1F2_9PROT|nr:hypothetical protein AA15669_2002 [Saccharibacter floricola DSM 15669]
MDALREVDGVAYVRFASVYRNFREIEAFSKILDDMNHPSVAINDPSQETP